MKSLLLKHSNRQKQFYSDVIFNEPYVKEPIVGQDKPFSKLLPLTQVVQPWKHLRRRLETAVEGRNLHQPHY